MSTVEWVVVLAITLAPIVALIVYVEVERRRQRRRDLADAYDLARARRGDDAAGRLRPW